MSGAEYRVEVHGSVGGNLVVGDHNLIVNAAVGSSVSVIQETLRPKPVRRPNVRVLPRRPSEVLGRSGELGTITAAVVGQSTIQVYGQPGIGKSTVLRQAAYDIADEADGVVFVSATGRSHIDVPQEIFEACYETSGYRPSPTDLRRLMSGVRAAVVIDDLVCSPDELATVLDAAPDAAFVFAATDRELYGSGQVIELRGLSEEAALALVGRELGRALTAPETEAVRAEWRLDAGSPMRLLRAAALLSRPEFAAPIPPAPGQVPSSGQVPPVRSVPLADQATVPMDAAAVPGSAAASAAAIPPPAAAPVVDLNGATQTLIESLPAAERDVYQLLGFVAPASVTVPVIAVLVATSHVDHVATAVARLVEGGLVERAGDAYRIAEDLVVPIDERTYRRDVTALVAALQEWLIRPDVTPTDVSEHGELIVELIEAAVRANHADLGSRLARTAAPLAALSLRWGTWRDVLTSGQAAAKACDDREAYAYFTHERGIRLLCLGQAAAAAAVLATAVGLWQALGLGPAAAIAAQAQAIAAGAGAAVAGGIGAGGTGASGGAEVPAHAPVPHQPLAQPAPHPPAPQQPAPQQPVVHAASGARRAVGRARVTASGGFPTTLVVSIVVVVLALGAAAFFIVPSLTGTHKSTRPTPPPIATTSATPSTVSSPPAPHAFSDNTAKGLDPASVLDGEIETFWASTPQQDPQATDAWIAIDMGVTANRTGLEVTPRPRFLGFPSAFRIESSDDGTTWTTVPGQDYNPNHPFQPTAEGAQAFAFATPVAARFIRFDAVNLAPTAIVGEATNVRFFSLELAEMHVLS